MLQIRSLPLGGSTAKRRMTIQTYAYAHVDVYWHNTGQVDAIGIVPSFHDRAYSHTSVVLWLADGSASGEFQRPPAAARRQIVINQSSLVTVSCCHLLRSFTCSLKFYLSAAETAAWIFRKMCNVTQVPVSLWLQTNEQTGERESTRMSSAI